MKILSTVLFAFSLMACCNYACATTNVGWANGQAVIPQVRNANPVLFAWSSGELGEIPVYKLQSDDPGFMGYRFPSFPSFPNFPAWH